MSNAELQVCRLSLVLRSRFKKLLLSAIWCPDSSSGLYTRCQWYIELTTIPLALVGNELAINKLVSNKRA